MMSMTSLPFVVRPAMPRGTAEGSSITWYFSVLRESKRIASGTVRPMIFASSATPLAEIGVWAIIAKTPNAISD
ncbi:hypothetical protein RF679_13730 [Undibacterium cyanobacteriorum]|uniref:Uncharacterized protein n=1 Tax=Undibacterium cyanobacteriorum TaxID=3073561 RepID=A0ABY9RHX8_9BURK|nr:hypothetical protein [Undibacterium sp. 20NA77.5]WMW79706.1 hypothetical protein RF679_13730 [Undibacterium sp. 20NA77.5]